MKKYKVIITLKAQKQLKEIARIQAKQINNWIITNFIECSNPYFKGKKLKGNSSQYWLYKVGNYRLFTDINDDILKINIVDIRQCPKVNND